MEKRVECVIKKRGKENEEMSKTDVKELEFTHINYIQKVFSRGSGGLRLLLRLNMMQHISKSLYSGFKPTINYGANIELYASLCVCEVVWSVI